MQLEDIIAAHARYAPEVAIRLSRKKESVLIKDRSGSGMGAIHLTGESGKQFMEQLDCLVENAPALSTDLAMRFLARPYTERLWR